MTTTLKFHPLADIFPLMEGAEFDELVADIKANGQRDPIILFDGQILDGRNRYRACLAAGIKPDVIEGDIWVGNPAAYVISVNIRRRHLKAEAKWGLIRKVLAATPEKSDRSIAKEIVVSPTTVGAVREEATVQSGQLNAPEPKRVGADGKARRRPAKTAKKADRKARERREAERCKAEHEQFLIELAAAEAEAERLAADLIAALDRNLAQRLHAHLGEGIWLKEALGRGLGLKPEGNGADDPQASADQRKAEFAKLDSTEPEAVTAVSTAEPVTTAVAGPDAIEARGAVLAAGRDVGEPIPEFLRRDRVSP
jgi:hypothetical protein